jgi:1,4-dihydroxy-2-naphthoate octaprenyltransferase
VTGAGALPVGAGGTSALEPGPVKRWILGARPRTLPAALVPVLVGTAAAQAYGPVRAGASGPRIDPVWCAVGALIVALSIQVGTNYANDYSDGVRGTDDARVGPVRLVATGLARPSEVRNAALASFAVAGMVGLGLAWATSWWVVAVGAACLLAGWFYTGGPKPYGYAGLGEVFVFVFFGLVATVGTFYVQTLRLGQGAVWLAAAMVGLLATALLLANNLRDIATDATTGKRTVAVRLGRRRAGWLYLSCVALPFAGSLAWGIGSLLASHPARQEVAPFLSLLALPLAMPLVRTALGVAEGRALLPVLAGTAKLQLAFGVLLSATMALWFG